MNLLEITIKNPKPKNHFSASVSNTKQKHLQNCLSLVPLLALQAQAGLPVALSYSNKQVYIYIYVCVTVFFKSISSTLSFSFRSPFPRSSVSQPQHPSHHHHYCSNNHQAERSIRKKTRLHYDKLHYITLHYIVLYPHALKEVRLKHSIEAD